MPRASLVKAQKEGKSYAEWYKDQPEEIKEQYRKAANKHYYSQIVAKRKYLYGITEEDYQALLAQQKGLCAICGCEPKPRTVNNGKQRVEPKPSLDIDHCHQTGTIRGLLCNPCNRGLGIFKDDVRRLEQAIAYLERTSPKENK